MFAVCLPQEDPSHSFFDNAGVVKNSTTNAESTACFILTFAKKACRVAVENAEWDKCLNQEPGKPAFLQQPPSPQAPTIAPPATSGHPCNQDRNLRDRRPSGPPPACWNCGSTEHTVQNCPHPRDEKKIRENMLDGEFSLLGLPGRLSVKITEKLKCENHYRLLFRSRMLLRTAPQSVC